MSQPSAFPVEQASSKKMRGLVIVFLLIAAAGLLYVKWWPYYQKTILAATTHSIGTSILGTDHAAPSWSAAMAYATAYFKAVWKAAVLGILLGSLLQVMLPSQWLLRVLGKTSFGSTAAAGVAAVPGMMCTCCAAPIAVGLRKKNVSVGAALAFWIGNPTINPATLVFMTFVLSWKFTAIRLVFGLILTFGISYFANRFAQDVNPAAAAKFTQPMQPQENSSFLARWAKSIGSMILYTVPAYILAVLLLGAVRIWLFPTVSPAAADSLLAVIGFAIAGMLFVIPTAAEIPIIQALIAAGLGMGPAAALLITLPAVSLPSLLMVSKSFPKKVLVFVAASVVVLGILSGIAGMLLL